MAHFKDYACFENATILRETDRAFLVEIEGAEYWIPKSQIDEESEVGAVDDCGILIVSQWFADRMEPAAARRSTERAEYQKYSREVAGTTAVNLDKAYQIYRRVMTAYHPDVCAEPWATGVAQDFNELWQAVLKGCGKR